MGGDEPEWKLKMQKLKENAKRKYNKFKNHKPTKEDLKSSAE